VLRAALLLALAQVVVDASWYLVVATAVRKTRKLVVRARSSTRADGNDHLDRPDRKIRVQRMG
jgi:hypothetical protein